MNEREKDLDRIILHGDVVEHLSSYPVNYFDACFCDPPYLLKFMGKEFDRQHTKMGGANEGQKMQAWHERWTREVLRVLKPGAHMLAFGGTRTYHRLVCAAEDVGFGVRDMLTWLHGQGFPKNKDTQLKPAVEPCVLVKKPGGQGKLNIGGCRISHNGNIEKHATPSKSGLGKKGIYGASSREQGANSPTRYNDSGRWPANLILSHHPDCRYIGERKVKANQSSSPGSGKGAPENPKVYARGVGGVVKPSTADEDGMEMVEIWDCHPDCPVRVLDKQSGQSQSRQGKPRKSKDPGDGWGMTATGAEYSDSGGASRFFYCAKVSTRERNLGGIDCRHPTLKPIPLCTYLSCLLMPPPHPDLSPRRILIPFSGAGSEIAGALLAGWDQVVGIEMNEEYISWSETRVDAILKNGGNDGAILRNHKEQKGSPQVVDFGDVWSRGKKERIKEKTSDAHENE